INHRSHYFGVTWGPFLQIFWDQSVPGLDSYGYGDGFLRAYYSWRFWREHELELRSINQIGYHLPLHEELALGGVTDLRGYQIDQFRGDINLVFRAEYSLPLFKWTIKPWLPTSFRALAFWEGGYNRLLFPRTSDRIYLSNQFDRNIFRNDVGV